jgi:hypothetical protein
MAARDEDGWDCGCSAMGNLTADPARAAEPSEIMIKMTKAAHRVGK